MQILILNSEISHNSNRRQMPCILSLKSNYIFIHFILTHPLRGAQTGLVLHISLRIRRTMRQDLFPLNLT